jgi:hypothetical protein
MIDPNQTSATLNLLDLGVEQTRQGAPDPFGLTDVWEPLTEVSRERVEVQFEAVTTAPSGPPMLLRSMGHGQDGQVRLGQCLTQLMNQLMRSVLSTRAEDQRGNKFGGGVERHPQPQLVGSLPDCREEFVKLDMRQLETVTEMIMQALGVKSGTCQPEAEARLPQAEDALQGVQTDALGEQREHRRHDPSWSTQAIEGRVAAHREFAAAGLTHQVLDPVAPVSAVAHERMHTSVRNRAVSTLGIAARVTGGVDGLLAAARAFDHWPSWRRWIGPSQTNRSGRINLAVGAIVGRTWRQRLRAPFRCGRLTTH